MGNIFGSSRPDYLTEEWNRCMKIIHNRNSQVERYMCAMDDILDVVESHLNRDTIKIVREYADVESYDPYRNMGWPTINLLYGRGCCILDMKYILCVDNTITNGYSSEIVLERRGRANKYYFDVDDNKTALMYTLTGGFYYVYNNTIRVHSYESSFSGAYSDGAIHVLSGKHVDIAYLRGYIRYTDKRLSVYSDGELIYTGKYSDLT